MSAEDREDNDLLQSLIANILEAEKTGESIDRESLLSGHPENSDSLREFFADHDQKESVAKTEPPRSPTQSIEQAGENPKLNFEKVRSSAILRFLSVRSAVCLVAYLFFQFFLYVAFTMLLPWPNWTMYGPRDLPAGIAECYLAQFILLPFLPWRLRVFCLLEFGLFLGIHVAPVWPMTGNAFGHYAAIPRLVWCIYLLQFVVLELRVAFAPWIPQAKTRSIADSLVWCIYLLRFAVLELRVAFAPWIPQAKTGSVTDSDEPQPRVKFSFKGSENPDQSQAFKIAVSIAIAVHAWALSILSVRLGRGFSPYAASPWDLIATAILVIGLFLALTLFATSAEKESSTFCDTIPKRVGVSLLALLSLPLFSRFFSILGESGPRDEIYLQMFFFISILTWMIARHQKRRDGLTGVGKSIFMAGIVGPLLGVGLWLLWWGGLRLLS